MNLKLIKQNNQKNLDFSQADLRGIEAHRVDLSGANFIEKDLQGADFSETNLSRANLTKASLFMVRFHRTNFEEADLTKAYAISTYLDQVIFYNTCLKETRFRGLEILEVYLKAVRV